MDTGHDESEADDDVSDEEDSDEETIAAVPPKRPVSIPGGKRGPNKNGHSKNYDAVRQREYRAAKKKGTILPPLLPLVEFSFPNGKTIQKLPSPINKADGIILQNRMTLHHRRIKASDDILADQKGYLHTIVTFIAGHELYKELIDDLIEQYPTFSIDTRNDIKAIANHFLAKMQVNGLSTYKSLRHAFRRYAEWMEEHIIELEDMLAIAKEQGTEQKHILQSLTEFKKYLIHPKSNLHGVKFMEMYGAKPLERKTAQSTNGAKGIKVAAEYMKQAFFWVVKLAQCFHVEKLDSSRDAMNDEAGNIKADVGRSYQENETDRQKTKKKAFLTHDDQLDLRRHFLSVQDPRINKFIPLVFSNMAYQMMTRAKTRRYTEWLDMYCIERPTEMHSERDKDSIPKMMVTCFIDDNNKLSHFFSRLGQDDKSEVSAGTHRDACKSTDVAIAQYIQQRHVVMKVPFPPFHEGYDRCKRFALLPGKNPEEPMSAHWLNNLIKRGLVSIGRYFAGLVNHLERKQGSYWREALGCHSDDIENANWGIGQKAGKKAVYRQVYNKGFPLPFIVVSTDHGVGAKKELYYIPWDVEVPEALLSKTWVKCNRFFKLVDSNAPGFGDNEAFKGLAGALKMLKKRLYQGTAHMLYTGVMKEDDSFLNQDVFQSGEFALVCKRVTEACDAYKETCKTYKYKPNESERASLAASGACPDGRIFGRLEQIERNQTEMSVKVDTVMEEMGSMSGKLDTILKLLGTRG
ncbi:hypothetical protein BCR33DRAFT_97339 [Rhizoclosmatium globosum]|uniref:Ndc10 domain-containing protein n=1 Tax=Rhizoclosmatium globosum TaxID=329046 RepID=A0A1Y2CK92_9FUNG|nr:hypothetical protein BCR33DRAFT_97339 [Rhizoclosmatium globosum]|eukprot:ORY47438.1 hypothetical protein BCR33DRAFT_97339 [Rhizoclosmatium globosum]